MVKISFKLDKDQFREAILKAAGEKLAERAKTCKCPSHHQSPEVTAITDPASKQFSLEISGCCDLLLSQVKKKLGVQDKEDGK